MIVNACKHKWDDYGMIMEWFWVILQCVWHERTMYLACVGNVFAIAMLLVRVCNAFAMWLQCVWHVCNVFSMLLQCVCNISVCCCNGIEIFLTCVCNVVGMLLQCLCNVLGICLQCFGHVFAMRLDVCSQYCWQCCWYVFGMSLQCCWHVFAMC